MQVFPKFLGLAFTLGRGLVGGSTVIQTAVSGKELRLPLWSPNAPRRRLTLNYDILNARQRYAYVNQVPVIHSIVDFNDPIGIVANDADTLEGFFLSMQGSAQEFWYDDPDATPIVKATIGTADGITTQFQLVRNIAAYQEIVQNPNGTPLLPTATWTAGRTNNLGDTIVPTDIGIIRNSGRAVSTQSIGWPCYYEVTTAGTSGAYEPQWYYSRLKGQTVQDGGAVLTCRGVVIVMFINGIAQDPSTYSIGSTGIVSFGTAPTPVGDKIQWTGGFYHRCRFLQDTTQIDEFMNNFYQASKVDMISVKL